MPAFPPSLPGLEQLLAQHFPGPRRDPSISRRALRGGLEADGVELVVVCFADDGGRPHRFACVAKHLSADGVREVAIYRDMLSRVGPDLAPRLLGVGYVGGDARVLYLEPVRPIRAWPWPDIAMSRRLLERVAELHGRRLQAESEPPAWNYDLALVRAGTATLEEVERCRGTSSSIARLRGPVKRLVLSLPRMRRTLLASPLGTTAVHGDLHSGNVIVRRRTGRPEPVLLDWGRARIGSPLEDVSSWLQSLGFWEPETRRRHDTLLAHYLTAAGRPARLDPELRQSYWLAAACNVLAGALTHHLTTARTAASPRERLLSARAAQDGLRVLRRADALWS